MYKKKTHKKKKFFFDTEKSRVANFTINIKKNESGLFKLQGSYP